MINERFSSLKEAGKSSSSFLSVSSASASWPDQISPLDPSTTSVNGVSGGFEALGVRPRGQPAAVGDTDSGSGESSAERSTPVFHHYHHHFHHTQPPPGGGGGGGAGKVLVSLAIVLLMVISSQDTYR